MTFDHVNVWRPTPEWIESANITRLMRKLGYTAADVLGRNSIELSKSRAEPGVGRSVQRAPVSVPSA